MAEHSFGTYVIGSVFPVMEKIEPACICSPVEIIHVRIVDIPVDCGEDAAQDCIALVKIFLQAPD